MNDKRRAHLDAMIRHDQQHWLQGLSLAGIDEVGRGPLAGCVMAACVVLPSNPIIDWMDDSKALSQSRREKVYSEIMRIAQFVGIGRAEPEEIDQLNIRQATRLAMRRAAESCGAHLYLVDAEDGLGLAGRELAIIQGDATSYSIAAASIVAKVTRDREMCQLDERYPVYGFVSNKGYGTAKHMEALRAHGPSPVHRISFLGKLLQKEA